MRLSTFSIVACDLEAREWGVAVQSKFLAVGPVVPWAEAEVGVIATQSHANTSFGAQGLRLLRSGLSAQEVLRRLIEADKDREKRQVGIVDSNGRAAAFTGEECFPWAGHHVGQQYACQGNILAGGEVVRGMSKAFESTKGALAERPLASLHAGQAAGGDRRGQQSASLHVVKVQGGYGGYTDRFVDLRVDDHTRPIEELERIFHLQQLYFGETRETIQLKMGDIKEIQAMLLDFKLYSGAISGELDQPTRDALQNFHNIENLEMRWQGEPGQIDIKVLHFMREKHRTEQK
ncbi:DUF1028 domain-containing protein [Candidatus Acetothermia bacterium]|nr:DUF1028 domain-containing protein [Candidatus Acetothermia bacterium]MBI3643265.1 DUF1028 domain-containing protein [Candidatus Acetothermia bacterium]